MPVAGVAAANAEDHVEPAIPSVAHDTVGLGDVRAGHVGPRLEVDLHGIETVHEGQVLKHLALERNAGRKVDGNVDPAQQRSLVGDHARTRHPYPSPDLGRGHDGLCCVGAGRPGDEFEPRAATRGAESQHGAESVH
jgi:hypothetical protein